MYAFQPSEIGMPTKRKRWYAGHAIFIFKVKRARQQVFTVWENVYLLKALSFAEAHRRTVIRAREDEEREGWRVDGQPAELVLEGVRKVVECTPDFLRYKAPCAYEPHDGMEVTFNSYRVDSREALRALLHGKEVTVTYEE